MLISGASLSRAVCADPNKSAPNLAWEEAFALTASQLLLQHGPGSLPTLRARSPDPAGPEFVGASASFADWNIVATQYALRFLTYAYTVPFRQIAIEQELSDVFEFSGEFDDTFIARWEALTLPERAAFSQAYREFRRMQALGRSFADAELDTDVDSPLDDRAARFVGAHIDGLEKWQDGLHAELRAAPPRAAQVLQAVGEPGGRLPAPLGYTGYGAFLRNGTAARQDTLPDPKTHDSFDIASVLESLAPIDAVAKGVLDQLCARELMEAKTRFLSRVRWLLALPNQQRIAVALRTTGKKRREVAKTMGISEESVKTHLARADDDWRSLNSAQKSGAGRAHGKAS